MEAKICVGDYVTVTFKSSHLLNKVCEVIGKDKGTLVVKAFDGTWHIDENSVEKTRPPFNLEQFKAGVPAITRNGRVASYYGLNRDAFYPIIANIEGDRFTFTEKGVFNRNFDNDIDLIYMQEPKEKHIKQPSQPTFKESLYEWFKQYCLSDLVIDSLGQELNDCQSSQEFDEIIDSYRKKISFN